jgi:hypothetical protein
MYEKSGLVGFGSLQIPKPNVISHCVRRGLVHLRNEDEDQLFLALVCERFFLSSITPIWEFARSRTL